VPSPLEPGTIAETALLARTGGAINPAQLQVIENLDVAVSVTEKI
jgi:hypothetical protein